MGIGRLVMAAVVVLAVLGLSPGAATAATPDNGAIAAKYQSTGGASGPLGAAITPLRCGLVHGGCYRAYHGGSIHWSAGTGAHVTLGGIAGRWAVFQWERGFLGYPVSDENCTLAWAGCVQSYQGGYVYWQSSVSAHTIHGGIGRKWVQMGYERNPLGYPSSEEACSGVPHQCVQQFLGGSITWVSGGGVSVNPNARSVGVVVNKRRPNSPVNQTPPDLVGIGSQLMRWEAANQLTLFLRGASGAGVAVTTVSGFRSYSSQASLYNYYVSLYGQAVADTISARPGYSEHQTGLVMDIGNPDGACGLQACFAGTPAGQFAAANSWRYGFIIRYPNGYDAITGYTYEPWHLRYIGVRTATDMHYRGYRTLEQYFGLPAAPSY
ncbi:D-alanyl-D-alanine carboxypeptidase family protein [Arthrobacter sp. STN4]|uniref:D-alanyl-D-alanine carboxypeptidase family protein n=1 Tax=Arthrobacter sp. STN4 TaxID=2923276 RepID=UPI002119C85B|nr:D-alanyl-D-alanine carboxypeptidase family protein [Arthrobacter sp. STN4]MCQ9164945.1 D-alanyl-D-alanine carboxypeptidase family protein [Arthrobacter sp. STN4]